MYFKVIKSGTNRKLVYDFLLVCMLLLLLIKYGGDIRGSVPPSGQILGDVSLFHRDRRR